MEVSINESWKKQLNAEFVKAYFIKLKDFLREQYSEEKIYPPSGLVFNAFEKCTFHKLKVVIIGQDPYHGPNQANGLSFSVNDGVRFPPSLKNIFKELQNDLGKPLPDSGNLERWAIQGVFLLNATLTVKENTPGSHQNKGWEEFTDQVIKIINEEKENIVFILWGAYAQKKGSLIDENKHLVIKSFHPSPFSARKGFFGGKYFSKTNAFLREKNIKEIDW